MSSPWPSTTRCSSSAPRGDHQRVDTDRDLVLDAPAAVDHGVVDAVLDREREAA